MARFFNTAGPCDPASHYMIPPESRVREVRTLIDRGLFFVLHAARQTGKTTYLNSLARALNAEGHHTAVVLNVEFLQPVCDLMTGNVALITQIRNEASRLLPEREQPPDPAEFVEEPPQALLEYLRTWAERCPKPLVLLIDEIDSLSGELLISILRQLRTGYLTRPLPFARSVALVGLRDVRDYRASIRAGGESLGTASPFNIKSESLTLRNFSREEIDELFGQHTGETGQRFEPDAIDRAFYWTQGQPWLVNAIASRIVDVQVTDRSRPITAADVDSAKEALILRRDTHIDSLADKLREPRVRRVLEPILSGDVLSADVMNDDLIYVRDLGLVAPDAPVRIANPIYGEVIPRSLNFILQETIPDSSSWYRSADGGLDIPRLLAAFQSFYAQHSEAWLGRYDYQEAGPHLILMAFLQRIVNGGGTIHREFAIGSGRADLVVEWKRWRYVFELKVRRGSRTEDEGVLQLSDYLARLGERAGYLVLFDRRKKVSWSKKLYTRQRIGPRGERIDVYGV